MAASVTLASPTVGNENNRTVTIQATVGAPADASKPVQIHWCVIKGTIPAGYVGGRGPATLVFAPGCLDPGDYNVKCVVIDPSDATTAEANKTFTIPKAAATVYTPPVVSVAP